MENYNKLFRIRESFFEYHQVLIQYNRASDNLWHIKIFDEWFLIIYIIFKIARFIVRLNIKVVLIQFFGLCITKSVHGDITTDIRTYQYDVITMNGRLFYIRLQVPRISILGDRLWQRGNSPFYFYCDSERVL